MAFFTFTYRLCWLRQSPRTIALNAAQLFRLPRSLPLSLSLFILLRLLLLLVHLRLLLSSVFEGSRTMSARFSFRSTDQASRGGYLQHLPAANLTGSISAALSFLRSPAFVQLLSL